MKDSARSLTSPDSWDFLTIILVPMHFSLMQPFQECAVAFGRNLTEHKHPELELEDFIMIYHQWYFVKIYRFKQSKMDWIYPFLIRVNKGINCQQMVHLYANKDLTYQSNELKKRRIEKTDIRIAKKSLQQDRRDNKYPFFSLSNLCLSKVPISGFKVASVDRWRWLRGCINARWLARCRSHIFAPHRAHHYAFIIHPLFWFGTRGIYNFYLLQRPTI